MKSLTSNLRNFFLFGILLYIFACISSVSGGDEYCDNICSKCFEDDWNGIAMGNDNGSKESIKKDKEKELKLLKSKSKGKGKNKYKNQNKKKQKKRDSSSEEISRKVKDDFYRLEATKLTRSRIDPTKGIWEPEDWKNMRKPKHKKSPNKRKPFLKLLGRSTDLDMEGNYYPKVPAPPPTSPQGVYQRPPWVLRRAKF